MHPCVIPKASQRSGGSGRGDPSTKWTRDGKRLVRVVKEVGCGIEREAPTALPVLVFEPALGFDRGHAARARGGHSLAVVAVLAVARGEDAAASMIRASSQAASASFDVRISS